MVADMLDKYGKTFDEYMSTYNEDDYKHPSVAVDVVLFTEDHGNIEVMLVKRDEHPFAGCWATPGTFVGYDEDIDSAAERVIKDKLGLDGENSDNGRMYFRQLHTFGKVDRDPRTRVISVGYISMVPHEYIEECKNDSTYMSDIFRVNKSQVYTSGNKVVSELTLVGKETGAIMRYNIVESVQNTWIKVESTLDKAVSNAELAGDHIKMLFSAIKKLEGYGKDISGILNILPEYFTLGDVQRVYESITGIRCAPANFRKKLLNNNLVIEVEKTKQYRGRDVQLYTANRLFSCTD